MNELLNYFLDHPRFSLRKFKKLSKKVGTPIPIFEHFEKLEGRSLYRYLLANKETALSELKTLLEGNAIDIEEKRRNGKTLTQLFVSKGRAKEVRLLLQNGARLSLKDIESAHTEEMKALLNYRPGKGQPSILEFCSQKDRPDDYLQKVNAIVYDQLDTTDCESSEAQDISEKKLSLSDMLELETFKRDALEEHHRNPLRKNQKLCLLAARGVHFSPNYFNKKTREHIYATRKERRATYSQSTLFDAGYAADAEVDETNLKIQQRHAINTRYISDLKLKGDCKERKAGEYRPPASRNDNVFCSLYYRFMQAYINSYHGLFDLDKLSIKHNFHFDSVYNPLISASWNIEKASMYASGLRNLTNRLDPHYRRFSGKPKHPNIGYIDLYAFNVGYVNNNGIDRQFLFRDGYIKLSSRHKSEQEIIFVSMIPKQYHKRRVLISLPSFEKTFHENTSYFSRYGIVRSDRYAALKSAILKVGVNKHANQNVIDTISDIAVKAQAASIKETMDYRLFKSSKQKAIVYNHGGTLEPHPFKL